MVKGWFVGSFEPTLINTNDVEVAVKSYKKGDCEGVHHHRIATEITVIISGKVKMNGEVYTEGDIVVIEPYEATDFIALEDSKNVVVKYPGASNDKYLGEFEHD
jgi:quercetin dioxygenase-like cupin family protein